MVGKSERPFGISRIKIPQTKPAKQFRKQLATRLRRLTDDELASLFVDMELQIQRAQLAMAFYQGFMAAASGPLPLSEIPLPKPSKTPSEEGKTGVYQ